MLPASSCHPCTCRHTGILQETHVTSLLLRMLTRCCPRTHIIGKGKEAFLNQSNVAGDFLRSRYSLDITELAAAVSDPGFHESFPEEAKQLPQSQPQRSKFSRWLCNPAYSGQGEGKSPQTKNPGRISKDAPGEVTRRMDSQAGFSVCDKISGKWKFSLWRMVSRKYSTKQRFDQSKRSAEDIRKGAEGMFSKGSSQPNPQ